MECWIRLWGVASGEPRGLAGVLRAGVMNPPNYTCAKTGRGVNTAHGIHVRPRFVPPGSVSNTECAQARAVLRTLPMLLELRLAGAHARGCVQ